MKDIEIAELFYHKWKSNGGGLNAFDDPHETKADELDECKQVNPGELDMTQVDVVWLVFDRHQHNQ